MLSQAQTGASNFSYTSDRVMPSNESFFLPTNQPEVQDHQAEKGHETQQTRLSVTRQYLQNQPSNPRKPFATQTAVEQKTPFRPDRLPGPVVYVSKLLDSWQLTIDDAIPLLGYEATDRTLVESILAGRTSLRGRDVKDRIASLFRIKSLVSELFREGELTWMRTPRPEFGRASPIDMLREGSMERLLTLRQYVEYMSGL